jgi:hemoglobin
MTTDFPLEHQSLYVRIGGAPAVAAAVDGLYDRMLHDPDLAPYFDGVGIEQLKAHQRAFVAAALGGPERYGGRSLGHAHRGLHIDDATFGKVVGHLTDTLNELGVAADTTEDVITALAPLQPQIVSAT